MRYSFSGKEFELTGKEEKGTSLGLVAAPKIGEKMLEDSGDGTQQDSKDGTQRDAVHIVLAEIHQDFLRFLTRRLGNREEARDVLQDFYVKVLSRIDDVRDSEKLRPWMRRVLETTLIDYYRAQGKRRQSETEYQYLEALRDDAEGSHELDLIICNCLYKLLPTLKPEYSEVIWRADLVGENRENIARDLDTTEGNIRVRLHRARQALRERFEETCRTCPVHGYLDCDCDYTVSRSNRLSAAPENQ